MQDNALLTFHCPRHLNVMFLLKKKQFLSLCFEKEEYILQYQYFSHISHNCALTHCKFFVFHFSIGLYFVAEEISGIFVKSIGKGSAADLTRRIKINDRIVEVSVFWPGHLQNSMGKVGVFLMETSHNCCLRHHYCDHSIRKSRTAGSNLLKQHQQLPFCAPISQYQ